MKFNYTFTLWKKTRVETLLFLPRVPVVLRHAVSCTYVILPWAWNTFHISGGEWRTKGCACVRRPAAVVTDWWADSGLRRY